MNCGDRGEALGGKRGHFLSGFAGNESSLKLCIDGDGDLLAVHNLKHLEELICIDGIATGLKDGSFTFNSYSLFKVKGSKNDLAGIFGIHMDAFNLGEGTFIRNSAKQGSDAVDELLAVKDNFHLEYSLKNDQICGKLSRSFHKRIFFRSHARKRERR